MRSLVPKALLFLGTALCINILCVNAASADSATYVYRGNNFTDIQGEPGVFSTKDRVTGHFTVNCSIAHPEGTCANLPYDNYFWMGAVTLESVELSAGPASLPTDDGHADVNAFWFSTDSNGQIVFWDIDLSLWDPSGIINVDTDKKPWGSAIDSAAASSGFANVDDDPGKWRKVGRPGMRPTSIFRNQSRTYGNDVGANVCAYFPNRERCADFYASENYDVKGTFQYTDLWINYGFYRTKPEGGWRYGWRWMSCQVGSDVIKAQQNGARLTAMLDPNGPECFSDGFLEDCDESGNCEGSWWGYSEPTEVTGEWIDPLNTSKAVVNQTSNNYDPMSDTFFRTVTHCNESGGDLMTRGGLSIGDRSFAFEGIDTQGWSYYWLRRCNDQQTEK